MLFIDFHTVVFIWIAALLIAALAQLLSARKEHVFSLANYAHIPGSVSFNKDKITFMFEQDRSYVAWDFFKCYVECNNQIYLFPSHKSGSVISFSSSDVGAVNYDELKQIIRAKKIACKCSKALFS
ncbi:MAG: hypothetical protein J0I41_13870 [Filimonas sp.]|nr:hypothetical protein [Filimonas sp.]